jgi:hypothetical protein
MRSVGPTHAARHDVRLLHDVPHAIVAPRRIDAAWPNARATRAAVSVSTDTLG